VKNHLGCARDSIRVHPEHPIIARGGGNVISYIRTASNDNGTRKLIDKKQAILPEGVGKRKDAYDVDEVATIKQVHGPEGEMTAQTVKKMYVSSEIRDITR
jgi:hypothetical protein